jgi:hypothetical protein
MMIHLRLRMVTQESDRVASAAGVAGVVCAVCMSGPGRGSSNGSELIALQSTRKRCGSDNKVMELGLSLLKWDGWQVQVCDG